MVVAEALLKMWCAQKHHVLLFSQSKMVGVYSIHTVCSSVCMLFKIKKCVCVCEKMLNILELMVQAKGYTYLRMDGDTPIKARQPLIRQFNEVGG